MYFINLLLDFRLAFVVDIHACHHFGDNRHGISVGSRGCHQSRTHLDHGMLRNKGL